MFQQNNLLDYAIEAYSKTMKLKKNTNFEFRIAQIYGEKGEFEKMFDSYVQLVDKDENYIGSVQRLASRYINDDPTSKNNIALKPCPEVSIEGSCIALRLGGGPGGCTGPSVA